MLSQRISFVAVNKSNRLSTILSMTLITRILTVGGSVVGGIVIARFLGAENVGIYAVLLLTINTLVQIVGAGLAAANVFNAGRDRTLFPAITANSIIFAALGGFAVAAVVYIGSTLRPDWFQNVPPRLLIISLATLPFQIWTLFGLNLFLALGDFRKFNLLDWFSQIYVPVNAVLVLVLLGRGLETLVIFNAVCTFIVAVTIFLVIRRTGVATLSPDLGLFRRMMRFGLNINIMNAALALVLRADVLLVNHFRGEAEAGVYSVAAQCSLLLIMFPNVVGTVIFPNVAGMKDGSGEFTSAVVRHAAAVQLLLCLFSIPAAFLLPFIYGPDFSPATIQFLVLLPGAIAIGLQMMLSQHLAGIGKITLMPYFWIFTLTLSIGLNLWLIPIYGGIGAAGVSTAAYCVIFLLTLFYYREHTQERISDVLLLRAGDTRAVLARFGW